MHPISVGFRATLSPVRFGVLSLPKVPGRSDPDWSIYEWADEIGDVLALDPHNPERTYLVTVDRIQEVLEIRSQQASSLSSATGGKERIEINVKPNPKMPAWVIPLLSPAVTARKIREGLVDRYGFYEVVKRDLNDGRVEAQFLHPTQHFLISVFKTPDLPKKDTPEKTEDASPAARLVTFA